MAIAGIVALTMAVWIGAALMVIARPKAVADGAPRAAREIARMEALLRSPGDPDAFPPGALCVRWPAAAAGEMRGAIMDLAAAKGLAIRDLSLTPGPTGGEDRALTSVAVRFQTTGPYPATLGFLRSLGKASPRIFLDTVDLKANVPAVDLSLNGRFYCSIYAPL